MKKHACVAEEEENWWLFCALAVLNQFTRADDNILFLAVFLLFDQASIGSL